MGPPSQRQVVALGRQRLAVQRLEERQKKLQQQTALVRAELYRAGISAKDDAGATARLARETSRYNQELSKQEARLKRLPPIYRIEAPTQIIIQTQPGQSAQDIAREVARQLDERERRLKAKARSNYSDQGGYDA